MLKLYDVIVGCWKPYYLACSCFLWRCNIYYVFPKMKTETDFTMLELLLLYHHDLTVKFCVSELFMNKT